MIVTELFSGLGNQMFQYAAGLSLAHKLNTELLIDKTWFDLEFEKQTPRNYGLEPFSIHAKIATDVQVKESLRIGKSGIIERVINKINSMRPYYKQRVYNEPYFHFDENFYKAKNNTYITGYWQSEKYFSDIREEVRNSFQLKQAIAGFNAELLFKMQHSMSVSLHVRRTDMVNNPEVIKTHGSCDLDYYLAAIDMITAGLTEPQIFIFSDDPQWCKENITLDFAVTYIDHNQGDDAYLDLHLMSHCRHHIIANSSFSWWGAWLNPSEDKRVIAPKQWFASGDRDTKDLIPSGWSRL
ncbi:MAG: alpha-1,2-fucosyltransferase [Bacteroidia bacterium]